MRIRVSLGVLVAMASLVACGGGCDGDTDASVEDCGVDAFTGCTSDDACRDDDFCNGEERCVEGACVPGDGPCGAGTVCDPTNRRCELGCTTDADGDGAIARSCGGTDCDDEDASRHPGATEVCDDEAVDEDCDPTTFGGRDDDGDGYEDARCCNDVAGFARCGTDCDDTSASVQPGSPEVCDDVDTDCDGSVDEGVMRLCGSDEGRCVAGIEANKERCGELVEQSLAMCTSLAPLIGYDKAAMIAKEAFKTGKTVREVALEKGVLGEDELSQALDAMSMTEPH